MCHRWGSIKTASPCSVEGRSLSCRDRKRTGLNRMPTRSSQSHLPQRVSGNLDKPVIAVAFSVWMSQHSNILTTAAFPRGSLTAQGHENWRICETLRPPILPYRWSTRYRPGDISRLPMPVRREKHKTPADANRIRPVAFTARVTESPDQSTITFAFSVWMFQPSGDNCCVPKEVPFGAGEENNMTAHA